MCRIHVVQNSDHCWARVKTNELSVVVRSEEFIAFLKLLNNYSALRIYLWKWCWLTQVPVAACLLLEVLEKSTENLSQNELSIWMWNPFTGSTNPLAAALLQIYLRRRPLQRNSFPR